MDLRSTSRRGQKSAPFWHPRGYVGLRSQSLTSRPVLGGSPVQGGFDFLPKTWKDPGRLPVAGAFVALEGVSQRGVVSRL